jgi:hypothetical protein
MVGPQKSEEDQTAGDATHDLIDNGTCRDIAEAERISMSKMEDSTPETDIETAWGYPPNRDEKNQD